MGLKLAFLSELKRRQIYRSVVSGIAKYPCMAFNDTNAE